MRLPGAAALGGGEPSSGGGAKNTPVSPPWTQLSESDGHLRAKGPHSRCSPAVWVFRHRQDQGVRWALGRLNPKLRAVRRRDGRRAGTGCLVPPRQVSAQGKKSARLDLRPAPWASPSDVLPGRKLRLREVERLVCGRVGARGKAKTSTAVCAPSTRASVSSFVSHRKYSSSQGSRKDGEHL